MEPSSPTTPVPAIPASRPKAAANIFWLIVERAVKAVGGVGMGILVARHLGPEEYGRYGAAIGLATLAKEAVMLGFDRMVRRDLAAKPAEAAKIIGTSITLGLLLAFAVALGITGISSHLADDAETRRLLLIVVWMALPQAFYSCEIWFESSGHTRPLVWTRNTVWLLSLVARLVLLMIDANAVAFAIMALVEWAVTYAAVCLLLRQTAHTRIEFAFDKLQLKSWFREGWPAVLMVIVGSTAERTMVLVVHNLSVNSQAGYLNAALRITEIWWSISSIVASILLPRIVALQRDDPERCARVTQLYANSSLLVGVGAAVLVSLTAPFLIPRLFGAAYAPSAIVLVILFWSGPAVFPAIARAQFWVSRGILILDLPSVTAIAILQIAFAVVLVPRYGAIGAACALTAAQWIGFYGIAFLVAPIRRGSSAQLHAFSALLHPIESGRELYRFVEGMIRKSS